MIATPAVVPASIPSPSSGTWDIFGFELRAYALCIMAGIVLAIWVGTKRWIARGGEAGVVADVAVWAVPFGIVGGRIYHVITDNQLYFREGRDPWQALRIWEGGLGIWGAIALGGVGVWIGCRRRGVPFAAMADALAPGILLAQAVGRWGNWFNQELFGRPTDLPWGLEIDPVNRPAGYAEVSTFHPTFLYESLWALGLAFLLIWLDRRYAIGYGRLFALYVAGYTLGRAFWESLRIDPANEVFGLRVNLWVSGLIFVAALAYFFWSLKKHPGREDPESLRGFYDQPDPFDENAKADGDDAGQAEEADFTLPDGDEAADGDGDGEKKPVADGDKVTAGADAEKKSDAEGDEPAAGEKPADEAAPAKKAAAKKAPAKTTAAKTTASKTTASKTTASKTTAAKKTSAATTAAPAKTTAKTTASKTTAAKTTAAKTTAAKKTADSATAAKKTAAKKTATTAKKAPATKKAPANPPADTPAPDSSNTPATGS